MTAPASGIFKATFAVAAQTVPLGWVTDTWKGALIRDAITGPTFNYDTDVGYPTTPWDTGEVTSGGGYSTGGVSLSGRVITVSGGKVVWRLDNVQLGPSLTLANTFRGFNIYNNTLSPKRSLVFINFGVDTGITDPQVVTIQWSTTPLSAPGSLLTQG